MTAHIQGKYRAGSDSLELAQFNLSTPASRVQASGTSGGTSTLRVSVSTSNLEEWRPLVTALGGPANLPFRVDGNATFNGVAERHIFCADPGGDAGRGRLRIHHARNLAHSRATGALGFADGQDSILFA